MMARGGGTASSSDSIGTMHSMCTFQHTADSVNTMKEFLHPCDVLTYYSNLSSLQAV